MAAEKPFLTVNLSRMYTMVPLTKIRADVIERTTGTNAAPPSLVSAPDYRIADIFREIKAKDKLFVRVKKL
jgi:hypothetical protein